MTDVVAALIRQGDRFLICRRPENKARGLLWEFPGGKVEAGETDAEALIRECREELDVTLSVGELFYEVVHEYPDLTVRLRLYLASLTGEMPRMKEHSGLCFITPQEIDRYDFCPADVEILERIRQIK
ncbi:MAG: (deoxy)nucleoside triphosphate pyrophosphohydrolase [Eubacteriales bacterium]